MSLQILRWKGGSCGDFLLKLILASNPKFQTNVTLIGLKQNGRYLVNPDVNKNNIINHLAYDQLFANIDKKKLENELIDLSNKNESWFIKSHYYDMNCLDYDVIDIIVDEHSLSYVMCANLKKTNTAEKNYNKLTKLIKNKEIAEKYALYNVGKDSLKTKNINRNFLLVSDIIKGDWNNLKKKLKNKHIFIDDNLEELYNEWINKNFNYFPSQTYLKCVVEKNYDYKNSFLPLHERYALMILSNERFKIL